jgi:hypothetical protein
MKLHPFIPKLDVLNKQIPDQIVFIDMLTV